MKKDDWKCVRGCVDKLALFTYFTEMCDIAYSEEKEMIMMGDLKLDFLKTNEVPRKWYDIMSKYHLSQFKTCIDPIYITHPQHVKACKVPHIAISDHFPAGYVRRHNAPYHTGKHTVIKYRSYKNCNEESFLDDLNTTP